MIIEKAYLIGFTGVLLLVLLIAELAYPAREYSKQRKGVSYFTNILLFLFNNAFFYLFQITAVFLIAYSFKLHSLFDSLSALWQVVAWLLILDFFIWLWHMLSHRSTFLWRFHKCHHSEKYLNVTSAVRFHLGELILSVLFKSVILIVFGIPFAVFLLYESLITIFAMFHHANIRLPLKLQYLLGLVIITQDMHRMHHSTLRHEHDSNYGVMFSWWDKIFGTYNTEQPKYIGIQHIKEKGFFKTLLFPFKKK